MSKEILNKVEEIGDLLNMIHGNQPKADTAFYELQKLKELLQAEEPESAWEMFRILNDKYGVYFCEKLMKYFETNHSGYMYSCFHKLTEQEAIKIMQEIEEWLKE